MTSKVAVHESLVTHETINIAGREWAVELAQPVKRFAVILIENDEVAHVFGTCESAEAAIQAAKGIEARAERLPRLVVNSPSETLQ